MTRPLNRRMITLSIMLATIMQNLDSTIANVALPLLLLIKPPSRNAAPVEAHAVMD